MAFLGMKSAKEKAAEEEARRKRLWELAALEASVKGIKPASSARGELLDPNKLPPPAAGPPPKPQEKQKEKDEFKDSPYNLKERIRKRGRNSMPEM